MSNWLIKNNPLKMYVNPTFCNKCGNKRTYQENPTTKHIKHTNKQTPNTESTLGQNNIKENQIK